MRILFLLLLASCGIFKSQNEIISINSSPQGLDVYLEKDKSLVGKTPVFTEVKKGSQDLYIFKYDGVFSKDGEKIKEYCDYMQEKKGSVVNIVNPMTYLGGRSFECIRAIRAKVELKKPAESTCKTLVVIPPKNSYIKNSLAIYDTYKKEIFDKNKNSCDKIISPREAEEYFAFLGIDHIDPPQDLSELLVQKIFKIGYKFSATHIVFLPHIEKGENIEVNPRVFEIHKGILETGPLSTSYDTVLEEKGGFWLSNLFLSSFRLIPNGVGIQANTANKLWINNVDDEKISNTYSGFDLGFTLDDIQYPLEKWAFNFRIVPVLALSNWGDQFNITVSGLTFDFKLYMHIPAGGVFIARAGIGGAYLDVNYPAGNYNTGTLSWLTDVGLMFYFFPSERIYLGLGYKRYFIPKNTIIYNGASLNGDSHLFFELGYFWPELRMGARGLL